jgi:hypothetical protein
MLVDILMIWDHLKTATFIEGLSVGLAFLLLVVDQTLAVVRHPDPFGVRTQA